MTLLVTLATAVAVAIVAGAGAAVKPKPWMWTTAQAQAKVDAALDQAHRLPGREFGDAEASRCRGTGKQPVRARWTAFACTFPFRVGGLDGETTTLRAWVKVRRKGQGGACLSLRSLATVNPRCLSAVGLAGGSASHAEGQIMVATGKRFTPEKSYPWQGFTVLECIGADGWYECDFESAVSGHATVAFRKAGATVTYTQLACTGAFESHPRCVLP